MVSTIHSQIVCQSDKSAIQRGSTLRRKRATVVRASIERNWLSQASMWRIQVWGWDEIKGVHGFLPERGLFAVGENRNHPTHFSALRVLSPVDFSFRELMIGGLEFVQCQSNLAQLVPAFNPSCRSSGFLNCRNKQRHQNADDKHHHQQFNDRETCTPADGISDPRSQSKVCCSRGIVEGEN